MKILFSNPPWWVATEDGLRQGIRAGSRWPFTRPAFHAPDDFKFGGYLPFPFFLASAAAYCARAFPDAHVELRDSIARGESYRTFLSALRDDPPDWLIAESATPSWDHDSSILAQIKAALPQTKIIVTGTITSGHNFTLPESFQAGVRGEYEKSVVAVIRDGLSGVIAPDMLTVAEMNDLPFPMQDEAAYQHHWDACPTGQLSPHLQLWTSRGCGFRCCFCSWPATMTGNDPDGTGKRSVRGHSPEWVSAYLQHEIQAAKSNGTPFASIYVDDDTFNLTDKHVLSIAPALAATGLPWSAMCRADTLAPDTWRVMRAAGCFGVKIGVESGSQRVIDRIINKRLDLTAVETKWLPLLKELGFAVHTTWTVGLPGETPAEQAETVAMIRRLYAAGLTLTHQLSGTAVIEGTPLAAITTQAAHLDKYPDARTDSTFVFSTDGQAKIEALAKRTLT